MATKNLFLLGVDPKSRPTVIRVRTYVLRTSPLVFATSGHRNGNTAVCNKRSRTIAPRVVIFQCYHSIYIYIHVPCIHSSIPQRFFCLVIARTIHSHIYTYIYIYKFNSAIIISKIVIPVAHRCYYWRNHHHRRRRLLLLLLPSPLQLPPLIFHHTFVTTSTTDQRYIHPPKKYVSSATTTMSRARYVVFVGMYWSICPPTKNETKCRSHCDILYLCIILSLFLLLS